MYTFTEPPCRFIYVLTQYTSDLRCWCCWCCCWGCRYTLATQPEYRYITNLGQMCRVFCSPLVYSVKVTNGGLRCDALILCRAVLVGLAGEVLYICGWESFNICIFMYAPFNLKYISNAWFIWVCGVDHGDIYVYMARCGIEMVVRVVFDVRLYIYTCNVGILFGFVLVMNRDDCYRFNQFFRVVAQYNASYVLWLFIGLNMRKFVFRRICEMCMIYCQSAIIE